MVYLPGRVFLAAIYFSTRASYLLAGKCCEADPHCSGCWMCAGSDLRNCWDAAVEEADACSKDDDLSKQVECLCASYGKIAFCWSQGRCCTEYAPTLSAATNLCNLKTYPADQLTKELVEKAENDAYNVRNTIWHNDSGYNVPKLSVYVKAYSSNFTSKANNQDNSSTNYKSNTNYEPRSPTGTLESERSAPSGQIPTSPEKAQTQDQYSQVEKPTTSPIKAHRQGKCSSRQKHKGRSHSSSQHEEARRDTSSRSPGKNAERWKRSERLNSSGQPQCGIDFHGVAYPTQVPQSVSQVFATL